MATRSRARDLYDATASVIGQERARKELAVVLDGQWQLVRGQAAKGPGAVLLGGRSGTGKSYTARLMCQHLGLPYAEVDATRYAEVAYKGLQLPQMFIPLLQAAARMKDGPQSGQHQESIFRRPDLAEIVEMAQGGVILLDEFDKWMNRRNHETGRLDTAIQGELLKLIEGSREFVTPSDDEVGVNFDTSKVLIICAGAFVGLYGIVRKRLQEDYEEKLQQMNESFWTSIAPEDFEKFGLLPELAGRLSRHIFTRPLQTHHMQKILTQPGGILDYYRTRYESAGVEWGIGDAGVLHLIARANEHPTGARALEFVANRLLGGEVLYEALTSTRRMRVELNPTMPKAALVPA